MYKKCYLMMAVMLLLFSGVASADIEINPSTIDLNLIGGDTVTKQITITWKGEVAVVGFIETTITPDGEGINVTYSEDPVILYPNTPNTIDMTIATAINIIPSKYVITTQVFTEIEKVIEYRDRRGTTTIYKTIEIENITYINILLENIQQLKDEINVTNDNCTEKTQSLNDIINILDDMIDYLNYQLQQEPEPEDMIKEDKSIFIVFLILIWVVLILVIALAILYDKFRVLELQRIKEMEENENKNK